MLIQKGITTVEKGVIMHQVNCQNIMGAGVDKDQMIELIKQGKSYPGQNRLGQTLMWVKKYHI